MVLNRRPLHVTKGERSEPVVECNGLRCAGGPRTPDAVGVVDEKLSALQRRQMVKLVRDGSSARSVSSQFGVSLSHLQYWVRRALGMRLDRVVWSDQPSGPKQAANRVSQAQEEAILKTRKALCASALGEWGALAIHAQLITLRNAADAPVPSVRTIGRVLARRGLLDGRRRTRRAPPPRGWYLPLLAVGEAELDSFDIVEGLVIEGSIEVEVFNAMSLHGRLTGSWPHGRFTAQLVMNCLLDHWQTHGLPRYVQFDNAPLFQGAISYADSLGRVVRLCLQLGVTPVFAPPRETGFQAAIESYNARWQAKVWQRFKHTDIPDLNKRSTAYVQACQIKAASFIAAATHLRRPFPQDFKPDAKTTLKDTVIFLRRSDEEGRVTVMGRLYPISSDWQHRLVRVEVNFTSGTMNFFGLRRAAHASQPLLKTEPYKPAVKQPGGLRALCDGATRGRRLGKKRSKP